MHSNKRCCVADVSLLVKRGITPKYCEGNGLLVLNQRCIRDYRIDTGPARRHDEVLRQVPCEKQLEKFDVLINSTGVGTLGRVAQVIDLPENTTVDSHVTIVRPNQKLVNPQFFGLAVRSCQNLLESLGEGTTGQTELSRAAIEKLLIPLPPLSEQRTIAEILGALDDKIELNRQMNVTLEEMAQALFRSWFVDFDPIHAKVKGQKPQGISDEIINLFPNCFQNSELGIIPKGWHYSKIGKTLITVLGGTPAKAKKEYWGNGTIPWINSGKANEFRITVPSANISTLGYENSTTKLLPRRTTVIAITGATLGQVSLTEIETCTNQSLVGVLGNEDVPSEYVYFWIKEHINELKNCQTGGAQQHINKNNVNDLKLLVPPKKIFKHYLHIVTPFFEQISNNCFQNQSLCNTRDALLPKLLSGEISVKEAERQISQAT